MSFGAAPFGARPFGAGPEEEADSGFTGTAAATAPSATASGTGTLTFTGTGAAAAPSATGTAAGWAEATGTAAATAPSATAAGQGALTFTGTGAATAPSVTAAGEGSFAEAGQFTGTGAATAPSATASGAGAVTFLAVLSATAPSAVASGAGWAEVTGTGAANAPSASANGAGTGGEDEEASIGGGWVPRHQEYRKGERRERGLEWTKRDRRFVRRSLERAYARMAGEEPATIEQAAERQVAAEIVRPFTAGSYDTPMPPPAAIDWAALMRDAAAARQLLALVRKDTLDLDIRRRVAAILLLSV